MINDPPNKRGDIIRSYTSTDPLILDTVTINIPSSKTPITSKSSSSHSSPETPPHPLHLSYLYKPVAKKVRTIPEAISEEFHITCRLPEDPLHDLPELPPKPPDFVPGKCFTQERANKLDLDPAKWLWPEELKLLQWLVLEDSKVQKIKDWPECKNVSNVRGFLGTCGVLHMFIKDFAKIARPLINLTKKDVDFEWGPQQAEAMRHLKEAVINSPALCRIEYELG